MKRIAPGFGDQLGILEDDYDSALLTLLYDREKNADRTFLFGVVELLPRGEEVAPELPNSSDPSYLRFKKSDHEINLRRVLMNSTDALEWYLVCRSGRVLIPRTAGEREDRGKQFDMSLPCELHDEPDWPYFPVVSERTSAEVPFWGLDTAGVRRHQAMAADAKKAIESLWNEKERREAEAWLRERFTVDLFNRSALWGSVQLLLPNPLFYAWKSRLIPDQNAVALRLEPRPGANLSDLLVTFREERPSGPSLVTSFTLDSPKTVIELPFQPYRTAVDVTCPQRGLLLSEPLSGFTRIDLQMDVVNAQRDVTVDGVTKPRGSDNYSVQLRTPYSRFVLGHKLETGLELALEELSEHREHHEASRGNQLWFDDDVEEATRRVRSWIREARRRILFVDPYFGWRELGRFGVAAAIPTIPIRVLTSKEFLLRNDNDERRGQTLLDALKVAKEPDSELSIEIRAMPSRNRAIIHDRFIMIDERIWLLGSSLNEFGSRGTTAVLLRHPAAVDSKLINAWTKSMSLKDFASRTTAEEDKGAESAAEYHRDGRRCSGAFSDMKACVVGLFRCLTNGSV